MLSNPMPRSFTRVITSMRYVSDLSQPVEPPDDDHIASAAIGEDFVRSFPFGEYATGSIGEGAFTPSGSEGILLQVTNLFEGGDTGITNNHALSEKGRAW